MFEQHLFKKISDVIWELPVGVRDGMNVPVRVYASKKMLEDIREDRSLDQLINVSMLPGIQKFAIGMPDMHEGYGFPVGGVAAIEYPDGIISPGGIGYDINCGVRLLRSELIEQDVSGEEESVAREMFGVIPSGVGRGGEWKLSDADMDNVLENGVEWAVKNGLGEEDDLAHIESNGRLEHAEAGAVSERAKQRGRDQLGTLGAGNHFAEAGVVDEIFDKDAAEAYGLKKGQVTVMIHTGSRGLGHQVATDYIRLMVGAMARYGIELPDRELACAPFSSEEGKQYYAAMAAAANFAWTNRQMITHRVREGWERLFGSKGTLSIVYDVAHNIAKIEEHELDGSRKKVIVHRKGATRAFGPGHPEIPEAYRAVGQPVLIPGTMGTASYVLAGTNEGMLESFGSCCHGAGRTMSRHAAKKKFHGKAIKSELQERGIIVRSASVPGIAEEAPLAYKDVDEVVLVVDSARLARRVARLRPLAVIKG
ncbi:MAG: RtcB family protein [Candidatus Kerfeldbacteria bacterium]